MTIRKRLAYYIFLMTAFLAVMGAVLLIAAPTIVHVFRKSLDSMDSLDSIRELRSNIVRQKVAFNRYLLVDDGRELANFEEATELARANLVAIKKSSQNLPSWLPEMEFLFSDTSASSSRVTQQYRQGNKVKAFDEATSKIFPKFQKLLDRVTGIEKEKSLEAQRMFEAVRDLAGRVELFVLVAIALAFIGGALLFRSLYRAVMKPLNLLKHGAQEFGKGHWDYRIDLPTNNEFGDLAKAFNTMADNVKQLQMQAVHMDRMSAVGQLAGGVAHEINNPLTAVLGQSQILLSKVPETDSMFVQLKKIEQAALRCKKIVRGLLDFSRPSQSVFEQIDIQTILSATLDLCEADLKRGRIVVDKRLAKGLPSIEGNSSELQQVLLNLVNNAIQAMPRGGTLTLETRVHSDPITIRDRRKGVPNRVSKGPWMEINIKDTGIGIAKEHLSRVFEPFFTTKEVGKGTGLGLAVSLGIVQKHGGDLRVDSAGLNRGCAFYLTLPLRHLGEHRQGAEPHGMAA